MKKYAVILKNSAALFLLIALLSLMLPICEVTVSEYGATHISGLDMMSVTAGAAKEYVHHGIIADDYVLTKGLTVGMVADGIDSLTKGNQLGHFIIIVIILALPGICCIFAMIATIRADEIKEMTLPMILIGSSILEMAGVIALFDQSCSMIKRCVKVQPSVGIYVCITLCILALILLILLKINEGFKNRNHKNKEIQ